MTRDRIKDKIRSSLRDFLYRDRESLLQKNVHEMSLSHRIALYMEDRFHNHDVDCEYNKHFDGSSKEISIGKIRPDIIVHNRNNSDAIIIIELKKAGHTSKRAISDINKLEKSQIELGYKLGAYIGVLKTRIDVVWIEDGEENIYEEVKTC